MAAKAQGSDFHGRCRRSRAPAGGRALAADQPAGERHVEQAEEAAAVEPAGPGVERVELAAGVAAADHRADRGAGDDVDVDAGLPSAPRSRRYAPSRAPRRRRAPARCVGRWPSGSLRSMSAGVGGADSAAADHARAGGAAAGGWSTSRLASIGASACGGKANGLLIMSEPCERCVERAHLFGGRRRPDRTSARPRSAPCSSAGEGGRAERNAAVEAAACGRCGRRAPPVCSTASHTASWSQSMRRSRDALEVAGGLALLPQRLARARPVVRHARSRWSAPAPRRSCAPPSAPCRRRRR